MNLELKFTAFTPDPFSEPEVDPEYLEHARREALDEQDQPDLPWDD
jgi:hypothetical protein